MPLHFKGLRQKMEVLGQLSLAIPSDTGIQVGAKADRYTTVTFSLFFILYDLPRDIFCPCSTTIITVFPKIISVGVLLYWFK